MQQLGWGRLPNLEQHHGIVLNDMRHGYSESGVGLDNVLRLPYFKAIYIGLGGAVYYRWGAYHLPALRDNLFMQLTLNFSV